MTDPAATRPDDWDQAAADREPHWDQETGEYIPDTHHPEDAAQAAPAEAERTAVDDAIDAQLGTDAIEKMVDTATADLIKRTLEKATRFAVARSLTLEQIERIHQAAANVVDVRFPHAASDPENDDGSAPGSGSDAPGEPVTDRQYTRHFVSWMASFLPTIESQLAASHDYVWCDTWWEHPEAVGRLKALWQAWEGAHASKDQRSVSSWWTDHWDRHLPTLLAARGPFRACAIEHRMSRSINFTHPPRTFTISAPPGPRDE